MNIILYSKITTYPELEAIITMSVDSKKITPLDWKSSIQSQNLRKRSWNDI